MENSKIIRHILSEDGWEKIRLGKFTASEIHRLMTEPTIAEKKMLEVLSKGAKTYVLEKLAQKLALPEMNFYSPEMERGNELEAQAAKAIADLLGYDTNDADFVYTSAEGRVFYCDENNIFGGTPDIILLDSIYEIKCPKSATHLKYMGIKTIEDFKTICENYYYQIQLQLFLTKKETAFFVSYDDRFYNPKHHLFTFEIPRCEETISKILTKIYFANQLLNQLKP
jgi:hypothetical protein